MAEDRPPPTPQTADFSFLSDTANIVETLCNLVYLIRMDAQNAAKVLEYAAIADTQLKVITEILTRLADGLPSREADVHLQ